MINFQKNKIILNSKELIFQNDILEAVQYKDKLIIVFDTKNDEEYNNVYCYDDNKRLIWRIKSAPQEIGGSAKAYYVGIDILQNQCRVIDFFGRRFIVNISNGEVLSKDIVR